MEGKGPAHQVSAGGDEVAGAEEEGIGGRWLGWVGDDGFARAGVDGSVAEGMTVDCAGVGEALGIAQGERVKEALLEKGAKGHAGRLFDDKAKQKVVRVGVGVAFARLELEGRVPDEPQ